MGVCYDGARIIRTWGDLEDGVRWHRDGEIIERYHGACRIFNVLIQSGLLRVLQSFTFLFNFVLEASLTTTN